jgi:hypothetical protein
VGKHGHLQKNKAFNWLNPAGISDKIETEKWNMILF